MSVAGKAAGTVQVPQHTPLVEPPAGPKPVHNSR